MMRHDQVQAKVPHQGSLVALREQKPGDMLDFRKLQPAIFSSMEKPWMHSSGQ